MSPESEVPKGENVALKKATSLFETVETGFDNVSKEVQGQLDKLRKGFVESRSHDEEKDVEVFAKTLYMIVLKGFKKDLDELSIHKEAQEPYIAILRTEWDHLNKREVARQILESSELARIDAFASSLEGHPEIMEAIKGAEPMSVLESRFRGFFAKNNLPGDPGDFFTKMLTYFGGAGVAGFFGKKVAENEKTGQQEDKNNKAKKDDNTKESSSTNNEGAEKDEDQKILDENIATYRKVLDEKKSTITILALMQATENESPLFEGIKGNDMEAQNKAVIEFMAEELKDFGHLTDITPPSVKDGLSKPGVLAFQTEGGGRVEYEVSESDDQIALHKVGSEETLIANNDIIGLKSTLEQESQIA